MHHDLILVVEDEPDAITLLRHAFEKTGITNRIATAHDGDQAIAYLKGEGRYTDDLVPQGQLRLVFVRSPYPHARIVSVDVAAAKGMPGVVYDRASRGAQAYISFGAEMIERVRKDLK